LPLDVFTQRNFVADFFRQKLNFTEKIAKSCFVLPFGGLKGNVEWEGMEKQDYRLSE